MANCTRRFLLLLVTVSLLLVAVYVPYWRSKFHADLKSILNGLLYQERRYQVKKTSRVAVGFGSCWDVVTSGVELMESSEGLRPPDHPKHHDTITTSDELTRSFAYFFQNGAAAERFVHDKDLFQQLVDSARLLNSTTENLGGNAPVIGQRLAEEGWEVLLASKLNKRIASTLHSSVSLTSPIANDTEADIHLILEFDLGERWGKYESPRGNRFIVHSDTSNMLLETLDGFEDALYEFNPDLLVIGGLQLMDNFAFDLEMRTERLKQLEELLRSLPKNIKVHFEMASFVEERLLNEIIQHVIPYADSLGMNEQELSNLQSMLLFNNVTYATEYNPRVATTLDHAREVYKILHDRRKSHHRLLSRLHVHTLAYQAIFTHQDGGWKHTRSAAAKAALMANRHVCASSFVDVEKAKLIMDDSFAVSREPRATRVPFKESEPVSCWFEDQLKVCIAPNLVCTNIFKTASAGDNISAAGLSLQI